MMATDQKTLVEGWNAANNFTASEDSAVLITNYTGKVIFWAITEGGLPSFDYQRGHFIKVGEQVDFSVKNGETLCLAIEGADADITITTGAA